MVKIGNDWDEMLAGEWDKPYYAELRSFLLDEYRKGTVYPPQTDIFNALKLTAYDDVKAVILGQDPYHEPGQAQGLAFSVPRSMQAPPSLINIMKEMDADLGSGYSSFKTASSRSADDIYGQRMQTGNTIADAGNAAADSGHGMQPDDGPASDGILVPWARQGVLLLNTVLTVRAHQAGSHRARGWEQFTDRVIELLAARTKPMVFVLWGANAGAKTDLILRSQQGKLRHLIIKAPHPSPLSAYRGFFGGRYFSRINYFLEDNGIEPIDWRL